ncbi:CDP-glycerol glycerophosphotransferase, TagB/SpsB family [Modestobacter sp. DSM 44400]|uniref:CDP-glycerol glycerophosphotransferase family protein n=1 Tax=Modestobacter sp. DSM 44400 TaxID=1550230 RepID=UPI000897B555|nr:CDP-glycerol glycerophosphotransferase family protein [Modestobacter sp. DSM 44400]SDY79591.1 CDP-glycerol glycerophosphotransferase, TagB/SpsB family [Modestobacter sp. DSM 44400]
MSSAQPSSQRASGDHSAPSLSGQTSAGEFPQIGTGSRFTGGRPSPRWLVHAAFALVNRVLPKDPSRVVLHSTVDVEDGLLSVAEECVARGWRPTVLLEDSKRGPLLHSLTVPGVTTVRKRSVRGVLAFLTARFVMTTSRLYGDHRPPRSQVVVSLWHGEPPTKVTARFSGRGGVHSTFAPVCSTVGRAYRAAEFDMHPLQVPIIGAPRNDRMLRADQRALRDRLLGADSACPTLLWMPSFRVGKYGTERRSDSIGASTEGPFPARDLERLDTWLDENGARVVLKVHPRDATTFAGDYRAIRVLRAEDLSDQAMTLYPVLSAFDGLITDMSSVWVDYLLLDKPMIFAFPDIADYRAGRGLNLEPFEHWVPGPLTTDVDGMIAAVRDVVAGRDSMAEERRRARLRFHQFHDDRSTARLLDGLGITAGRG